MDFTYAMMRKQRAKLVDIPKELPPLSEETKGQAMYIARAVREAMEDFHSNHLSDTQMKELNQIIRNAIATALYAMEHSEANPLAKAYILHYCRMIPSYWEPPVLSDELSLDGFINNLREDSAHFGDNLSDVEIEERAERILNMSLGIEQ